MIDFQAGRDAIERKCRWQQQGADADPEFTELMNAALVALQHEDAALRAALGSPVYDHVSRGLAYHVFEHNLVYTVFKAWAPRYRVVWDEMTRPGQHPSRQFIDLKVLSGRGDGKPKWLFEAKWWNGGSVGRRLGVDIGKLRRELKSNAPPKRAYVLAWWWGKLEDFENDFTKAEKQFRDAASGGMAYAGAFPTDALDWAKRSRVERARLEAAYFAQACFEVRLAPCK